MRKCTWTRPHERPGNPLDLDVASTFNVVGMEWSIQQIARLAGTTSRTLRHYDDIGLVPPSRIGLNGYRYYDGPALIRLQRVLLLRDLGLGLPQIADILVRQHDEAAAVTSHRALLRQEQGRLAQQIVSAGVTIEAPQGDTALLAETMFNGVGHSKYKAGV